MVHSFVQHMGNQRCTSNNWGKTTGESMILTRHLAAHPAKDHARIPMPCADVRRLVDVLRSASRLSCAMVYRLICARMPASCGWCRRAGLAGQRLSCWRRAACWVLGDSPMACDLTRMQDQRPTRHSSCPDPTPPDDLLPFASSLLLSPNCLLFYSALIFFFYLPFYVHSKLYKLPQPCLFTPATTTWCKWYHLLPI